MKTESISRTDYERIKASFEQAGIVYRLHTTESLTQELASDQADIRHWAKVHNAPRVLQRDAACSLEYAGGVQMFFDEHGEHIGTSTSHADPGFVLQGLLHPTVLR